MVHKNVTKFYLIFLRFSHTHTHTHCKLPFTLNSVIDVVPNSLREDSRRRVSERVLISLR